MHALNTSLHQFWDCTVVSQSIYRLAVQDLFAGLVQLAIGSFNESYICRLSTQHSVLEQQSKACCHALPSERGSHLLHGHRAA